MSQPLKKKLPVAAARVVVGLDFGTTFSGYGFAHKESPTQIRTFYEWPGQAEAGARPYCKTLTALYYEPVRGGEWKLKSWGWEAQQDYMKKYGRGGGQKSSQLFRVHSSGAGEGLLITKFKLCLAGKLGKTDVEQLPKGLTASCVVTDYLRALGELVMEHLREQYGKHFGMDGVQWCVTVPTIWDENAKRQMRECMDRAGLTGGDRKSSPHPLILVLEPEAASVYCCQQNNDVNLQKGDQFLVADIGGGTADLVVQEKATDADILQVVEVSHSTGGLCGGTHVDATFLEFLSKKIKCLNEFLGKNPWVKHALLTRWQEVKATFDGSPTSTTDVSLPTSLAKAWEESDRKSGEVQITDTYDEIELTCEEMEKIFEPTVERILLLMGAQMSQSPGIKAIMVVGGFSNSPYLMKRIKERFEGQVAKVFRPSNPGSAVCQGAVSLGFNGKTVLSRVARKTYGLKVSRKFEPGVDPEEYKWVTASGVEFCKNRFLAFVKAGSRIDVDQVISHRMANIEPGGDVMNFFLWSSPDENPRYVTDEGMVQECPILSVDLGKDFDRTKTATADLTMYFGRSSIQVKAMGRNFGDGEKHEMVPAQVDTEWIDANKN
jgi:hypothetical protein